MRHSDRFRRPAIFFFGLVFGLLALAPQLHATGRNANRDRRGLVVVDEAAADQR